jgi:hypothetical protein
MLSICCFSSLQLKERQKEDHMYDNSEKFITSAYRRKLEEDKKWQESQKLKYGTCRQLQQIQLGPGCGTAWQAVASASISKCNQYPWLSFQAALTAASPVIALRAPQEFASRCIEPDR